MEFSFNYNKNDNMQLFNKLEKSNLLEISKLQNYIPIYQNFFALNDTNFNNINLNHKYFLHEILEKESSNKFLAEIIDQSANIQKTNIFLKFSPLLDPIRYMVGKYDTNDTDLLNLPLYESKNSHPKARDKNNSAYIDGFFTYLTSQIKHNHNFIHGVDYYGSFLGIQDNFKINIIDDLEYLNDSDFFYKYRNILFNVDSDYHNDLLNIDTRNYKKRLNFIKAENNIIELSDIKDFKELDKIFKENDLQKNEKNLENDLIFDYPITKAKSTDSECSSRSSNTEKSNLDSESNSETEESDSNSSDSSSDEVVNAIIYKFPVQIICLEKCTNTLDSLILEGTLSTKEWESILFQIIMVLITYQTVYGLTHNDLHTNNIMYIETEKRYLYYRYKNKHYKIPTYGKIFKIIDFGRAIYKFRGNILCSDSYHPSGDAATQYNFEPYLNKKKPRLEPNFSFDLCRLACSLFDFLIEDIDELPKLYSPIQKIIAEWCQDDKGRNILYKNNGEERYPEFKLYKMIARTVHNHIPEKQLEKDLFSKYSIAKKKIQKNAKIMNIDNYPKYI